MVRVAGDTQRPLTPNLAQDVLGRLVGADEFSDVQRDDVRVALAADVILRDLGTWNDQQIVQTLGARRFGVDVIEVVCESVFGDGKVTAPQRQEPSSARQQIPFHENVVGDRDHVESLCPSIKVEDVAQRQATIAPLRVHVKVAEEKWFVAGHVRLSRRDVSNRLADDAGSRTRSCARTG